MFSHDFIQSSIKDFKIIATKFVCFYNSDHEKEIHEFINSYQMNPDYKTTTLIWGQIVFFIPYKWDTIKIIPVINIRDDGSISIFENGSWT